MRSPLQRNIPPRNLVGVDSVLARARRAWLIPDEIPVGLTLLLGSKSLVASVVAVDYAFRVARTYPVVFVGQNSEEEYTDLCEAWAVQYPKDTSYLHFDFDPLPLLESGHLQSFVNATSLLMPRLIIIDSAIACLSGLQPEISTVDALVNACVELQRLTGASLLLIVNPNEDGLSAEVRDHLIDRCDAALALDMTEDSRAMLTSLKTLAPSLFPPRYLNILQVELDEERVSYVVSRSKKLPRPANLSGKEARILRVLDQTEPAGGIKVAQVAEKTNITLNSTYRILSKLKAERLARQETHDGPVVITPQGKSILAQLEDDRE